ncbi:MAG: hypothetical protein M3R11_12380 [Acidobacteriota bacterium]|nr:hypothetical protein [Acidobacteriota bacterium]
MPSRTTIYDDGERISIIATRFSAWFGVAENQRAFQRHFPAALAFRLDWTQTAFQKDVKTPSGFTTPQTTR